MSTDAWVKKWNAANIDKTTPATFNRIAVIESWTPGKVKFRKLNASQFNLSGFLQAAPSEDWAFSIKLNASSSGSNSCLKSLLAVAGCLGVDTLAVGQGNELKISSLDGEGKLSEVVSLTLPGKDAFEIELQRSLSEAVQYHGVVLEQVGELLLIKAFPIAHPKLIQGLILEESHRVLSMAGRKSKGAGLVQITERFGAYAQARLVIGEKSAISPGTKVILEDK